MPQATSNRIQWIDEYKGFVLLLVCLYHLEQSFANIQIGMEHLSAFRMSAFFFISGVLFSTRRFPTFKSYFLHKTKVLFLPYITLSLLFLALDPVIYNFDWFPRAPKMSIMNIHPVINDVKDYIFWNLAKIFIAGKSSVGSGPIWFVFTLYSISLLFYLVQKITNKLFNGRNIIFRSTTITPKIFIALIACASLAAGWLLYKNHIRLPLGIERDLTTLFFFACGYLCKGILNVGNATTATFYKQILFAILSIVAFVLYALIEPADPNFSIMNNDLGKNFWVFLASSAFGILGLIGMFQIFLRAPLAIVKGIIRNISRNALIILAVHWWVLLVLRIIFKTDLDKPGIAYIALPIVIAAVIAAIPLFRSKLYRLLGKEKITVRESLSLK